MSYTPAPILEPLPDGSTRISVGEFSGIVSSGHLIEPKVHQLQALWLRHHAWKLPSQEEP